VKGDSPSSVPDERVSKDEMNPGGVNEICPVCGAPLIHEKCKVVCRSERCVYRIIFNCAEF
jgi:uncharacterized Zn finger protein (UPF0148 family)